MTMTNADLVNLAKRMPKSVVLAHLESVLYILREDSDNGAALFLAIQWIKSDPRTVLPVEPSAETTDANS